MTGFIKHNILNKKKLCPEPQSGSKEYKGKPDDILLFS